MIIKKGRYDVKYLIKAPHALNIPVFKNDLISSRIVSKVNIKQINKI